MKQAGVEKLRTLSGEKLQLSNELMFGIKVGVS